MAKIKYNVVDVETKGDFECPPTGVYRAVVAEVTEETSSSDSPMLVVIVELNRGDFKGLRLWNYIVLTDEQRWKLRQFLEATGLTEVGGKKGAKGTLDTDAVEGTEIQVRIKHETYEGEKKPKVAALLPLSEESEEEDEDLGGGDPDEEYTYAEIQEMDKEELEEVIEDEELDVRVTKKSKVDTLRDKVCEELELEEEGEEADPDDDPEEYTADEIREMDIAELKEVIKEEELEIKVTKKSKAEKVAEKVIEELEIEDDGDPDDEEVDYSEMSVAELKAECSERGIKATGKRGVLIARLEKDDEEDDDPFE